MKSTIEYQVCRIDKDSKTAKVLDIISADSLSNAVEIANGKYSRSTVRIYPFVKLDNPDSITEMARFTLASVENWERRNNYAVLNPVKRSTWDREDYISIATIAIIDTLTDNPSATMYDVKSAAFSAIRAEQSRQTRNSEREYVPGWITCNVQPRDFQPRATCPELDRLVKKAIAQTELSEAQKELFALSYGEGWTAADIATATGKSRKQVYKGLYRAYFWVLSKAIELDANGDIFRKAGYTADDITETLATLRKRGEMGKQYK